MYQQMYQTERYHLETLQQDRKLELEKIGRANLASTAQNHNFLLRKVLTSVGWRMVEIGSRLVERNSLTQCKDTKTHTRAAGLA